MRPSAAEVRAAEELLERHLDRRDLRAEFEEERAIRAEEDARAERARAEAVLNGRLATMEGGFGR